MGSYWEVRSYWEALERPGPDAVPDPGGGVLRAGSRVRLHPRPGGDVLDLALAGRSAVIEAIEHDMEDNVRLAVVVEDDPGRDLGFARRPGHRFFFSPEEVELLEAAVAGPSGPGPSRILVAGIGNVFLGDDGFGVALADRLAHRALPRGTDVVDFGIRGMDLAFAMQDGYDAVVMLDAAPRGGAPGTLYVIEADLDEAETPAVDAHGMDPVTVLGLVRALGASPPPTYVVACEPQHAIPADRDELVVDLSEPVRAALDPAVKLVESLLAQISTTEEVSST